MIGLKAGYCVKRCEMRLQWCNHCKEYSMVVKVYAKQANGSASRVQFCINKGGGNRFALPGLKDGQHGSKIYAYDNSKG